MTLRACKGRRPCADKIFPLVEKIAEERRLILTRISTHIWSLLNRYQSLAATPTSDTLPVNLGTCQQVHSEACHIMSVGHLFCLLNKAQLWENGKLKESRKSLGQILQDLRSMSDMSHSLYGGHRGCGPRSGLLEYSKVVEGMIRGFELDDMGRKDLSLR